MDKWQFEDWQRIRQQGRRRFVWRTGVLGFGFTIFLSTVFIEACIALYSHAIPSHIPLKTVIDAVVWAIGGYAFGAVGWWWREREYHKVDFSG
jgi:hypothetical protein